MIYKLQAYRAYSSTTQPWYNVSHYTTGLDILQVWSCHPRQVHISSFSLIMWVCKGYLPTPTFCQGCTALHLYTAFLPQICIWTTHMKTSSPCMQTGGEKECKPDSWLRHVCRKAMDRNILGLLVWLAVALHAPRQKHLRSFTAQSYGSFMTAGLVSQCHKKPSYIAKTVLLWANSNGHQKAVAAADSRRCQHRYSTGTCVGREVEERGHVRVEG